MNWNNVIQKEMKDALETLQQAFGTLHIDFYVIGAVARDIWFARSGRPTRKTKDIDFAVYVGTRKEYEALKQYLKDEKGFQDSRGNMFVLLAPSGLQVDILPFGGIELDGEVQLNGTGLSNIRVSGLQEVFETGTETVAPPTVQEFQVASLAGIVLLKLIAYDDRPEKRSKDARDIANIIENYFELQADLIYNEHNDLFGVDDGALDQLLLEEVAAEALGREIKGIIKGNLPLLGRGQNILSTIVTEREKSSFIREMVAETGRPVNELVLWLAKLAKGLR